MVTKDGPGRVEVQGIITLSEFVILLGNSLRAIVRESYVTTVQSLTSAGTYTPRLASPTAHISTHNSQVRTGSYLSIAASNVDYTE